MYRAFTFSQLEIGSLLSPGDKFRRTSCKYMFSHGVPLLHDSITATGDAEVPVIFLKYMLLNLTLEGACKHKSFATCEKPIISTVVYRRINLDLNEIHKVKLFRPNYLG